MRREWSGWIKERKWREFETLAKSDPSQPLADTIAELELGFPDKADRKALRKVLFLLGQQGYHPRPIDESRDESEPDAPPADFAYLTSPNPQGRSSLTYGRFIGGKYRMLFVDYSDAAISSGEESEVPLDKVESFKEDAREVQETAINYSEVPTDYARWRLNKAILSARHPLSTTIASWRTFLERGPLTVHPSEALPVGQATAEEIQNYMAEPMSPPWEVDTELIRPLAMELFVEDEKAMWPSEKFRELVADRIEAAKPEIVTEDTIAFHVQRLMDAAYIWHLREVSEVPMLLAIADDLRTRKLQSEYATILIRRACERITKTRESVMRRAEATSELPA